MEDERNVPAFADINDDDCCIGDERCWITGRTEQRNSHCISRSSDGYMCTRMNVVYIERLHRVQFVCVCV